MLKRKRLSSRKKSMIAMSIALSVFLLAVVGAAIGILASRTQTVTTSIRISYTSVEVDGSMRLRAYYKGNSDSNATWHNLTGTTQYGFITLSSDLNTDQQTQANLGNVTLDKVNKYIIIECAFKNTGDSMVKMDLAEALDTTDTNMTKTKKISRTVLTDFNDIQNAFNSYTSLAVVGEEDPNHLDDYVYYYVKVAVDNLGQNAEYSSTHTWTFTTQGFTTTQVTLDNTNGNGVNTTLNAISGSCLPVLSYSNMPSPADYTGAGNYGALTGCYSLSADGDKYYNAMGEPIKSCALSTIYSQFNDVVAVDYNGNVTFNNLNEPAFVSLPSGLTDVTVILGENDNVQGLRVPDSVNSIVINGTNESGLSEVQFDPNGELVLYCQDLPNLKSVYLPEGLRSINANAFSNCQSLNRIYLPKSITNIGADAFKGTGAGTLYYYGTLADWCNITFSNEYSNPMNKYAHMYILGSNDEFVMLTEINIPSGVQSIGNYQFYGFDQQTGLTIPDSVTSIGDYAFYGDYGLHVEHLEIPNGVTSIGTSAFEGCTQITNITLPTSLTSISPRTFYRCTYLESISIPSSVTSIGNSAFYQCSDLNSITIPSGVTDIANYTFYGCSSLTSVEIPSGVTSIGSYAFNGCTRLSALTLPSGVTSIGSRAFYNCSNLARIEIPGGVASLSSMTFFGCSKLKTVVINSSNVENITNKNGPSTSYLINYADTVYVKSDLTAGSYIRNTTNFPYVTENVMIGDVSYTKYSKIAD